MASATLVLLFSAILIAKTPQTHSSPIPLGSSLSPTGNSSWLSPSGLYAFGFYPRGNGFALGIWYDKFPEKNIVWTANRDDPSISSHANLVLTTAGRLILQEVQSPEISIANTPSSASFAFMLETGNFVLQDAHSSIIWQSFDYPTDTLLPSQRLQAGNELVASISETNHSTGWFRLKMQHDENLVMYPIDSDDTAMFSYWSTDMIFNQDQAAALVLNGDGHLYMVNSTGYIIHNVTIGQISSTAKTYRVTLDPDGLLRLYSHNLLQDGNWTIEWSAPSNPCTPRDICGLNGYCSTINQQAVCTCLPGFTYINQEQKTLGCTRNFSADSCFSKNENFSYTMKEVSNITWFPHPYSVLSDLTKEECSRACLGDCNCEAVLFQSQQCIKQQIPLMFGTNDPTETTITLVKVGIKDSAESNSPSTVFRKQNKKQKVGILLAGIACLTFSLLVLAVSGVLVFRQHDSSYKEVSDEANGAFFEEITLRSFKYEELERATNGFRERLGRGSFGTVFKGSLSNGQRVIAVKRLDKVVTDGEMEFRNEMMSIGKTHHKNLVRLLGFCYNESHRILVYEYMSNGSLANFIKSEANPSWDERILIALGIARGIHYLHEECEAQIIHCDINPNNILMDEHRSPKISDFGLAKLLQPNQSRTLTGIRGTRGYVAPEWHGNQPITTKANVYSFGIVLLEIICNRRSVSMEVPENEVVLVEWVYHCFEANELNKLITPEDVDEQSFHRMISIGLWCIQYEPSIRPSMKQVILMLEGAVDLPVPITLASFN